MKHLLALALLLAPFQFADGRGNEGYDVRPNDIENDRMIKLVGGVIGRTPGQRLGATFVELKPNIGREVSVVFPSHTPTLHETTIMNIVDWSVAWGTDIHELNATRFDVVFAIPLGARVGDFKQWYLVSIKLPDAKRERPKPPERPILADPQHLAVKLVAVRFSEGRQHDLLAKFAEVRPQRGREIELDLRGSIQPGGDQTTADVAHMRTILNIIESSVSPTPPPNARSDVTQWREPLFDVIFAIPKDAQGKVSDFSRWSVLSIKMPEAKKTQPKPSDK